MFRSWSLDSALLSALEEGRYIKEQTLLSIRFSPWAVAIDEIFAGNCVVEFFKHVVARFVSCITRHKNVNVTLRSGALDREDARDDIVHCAKEGYELVLSGRSIVLHTEFLATTSIAVLLLWRLTKVKRMMDVYGALRRVVPECNLTMREQVDLPMIYAIMCETTYTPSLDLIKIQKSILLQ